MKVIFVFTKSITFNIFLKKQAEYFMKNGLKVELACSDVKALNFNNILKHQIDFPITIKELQESVWSYQSKLETHTVETHIHRLRKKIKEKFNDENFIISTKYGYQINQKK